MMVPPKEQQKRATGIPPRNIPDADELPRIHPGSRRVKVYDVDYMHTRADNGGDLYVTEYGYPLLDLLQPSAWDRRENFDSSHHLGGSAGGYRVDAVAGDRSRQFILKWNRFGEHADITVPPELENLIKTKKTRFNSPFGEFSLVMQLRRGDDGENDLVVLTQKPLAIYSPPGTVDPASYGKDVNMIRGEARRVESDQGRYAEDERVKYADDRTYAVLYEWVKGEPAHKALAKTGMSSQEITEFTKSVILQMDDKGLGARDIKSDQIIVRLRADGTPVKRSDGSIAWVHADNELLGMTDEKKLKFKSKRRRAYFDHLEHWDQPRDMPEHLAQTNLMGMPFVVGEVPERGGHLLVLGRNPALFNYFLPQQWMDCKRTKIASRHDLFRVWSSDGLHLVWGVSKYGEKPNHYSGEDRYADIKAHGFNSPLEAFRIAFDLRRKGIRAVGPRAIYVSPEQVSLDDELRDESHFSTHSGLVLPDGSPALPVDRKIISVYGEGRGYDPLRGKNPSHHWGMTDLELALFNEAVSQGNYDFLTGQSTQLLRARGLNPGSYPPENLLLKFDESGDLELAGGNPKVFVVVNANTARSKNLINDSQMERLLQVEGDKLEEAGYESLTPLKNHLLLLYSLKMGVVTNSEGVPDAMHCLFDLYRKKG